MALNKKDKVTYLKDLYGKQMLLMNKSYATVDGIDYIVRDDKLVVINIHEIDYDKCVVLDNSFQEIDIKSLDTYVKHNMKGLDLSSVTKINEGAFRNCSALEFVKGNKIKSLAKGVFQDCKNLRKVEFSNLRVLGYDVFNGCDRLRTFNAPRVYSFGFHALDYTAIKELKFAHSFEGLGNPFFNMTSLKKVTVPNISLLNDTYRWSHIEYLNMGEFEDNKNYYIKGTTDRFYYCYMVQYKLSKEAVDKLLQEDSQRAYKIFNKNQRYVYSNETLFLLPRTLKELHYKLNKLDNISQDYYDRRFNILTSYGVKVVRDA